MIKHDYTIAIVGRTNVGKSTLFNSILGERVSIADDIIGMTRDRKYADVNLFGKNCKLIDTAGFFYEKTDLSNLIEQQTKIAIKEADILLFVVDCQKGMQLADEEVARELRSIGKPVVVIANKSDSPKLKNSVGEFYKLGLKTIVPISAIQKIGFKEMFAEAFFLLGCDIDTDAKIKTLNREKKAEEDVQQTMPNKIRIAIVGKPNVGKSTLINCILGEERLLVSDIAGTTTDSVDSFFSYGGYDFELIDTAGIRRKRSINETLEKYSVSRSLKALDRCHVACIVLDATEKLSEQDFKIASFLQKKKKGVIIVVNKWDKRKSLDLEASSVMENIKHKMSFLSFAPICLVSAQNGRKVLDILDLSIKVAQSCFTQVATSYFNKMLQEILRDHRPATLRGKTIKLYYGNQVGVNPLTVELTTNRDRAIHFSYKRYLLNQFRKKLKLIGAPICLLFKNKNINSNDKNS